MILDFHGGSSYWVMTYSEDGCITDVSTTLRDIHYYNKKLNLLQTHQLYFIL